MGIINTDAIVESRRRAGITQGELAQRMGITQQAISLLERGETDDMPVSRLVEFARVLDVDITELLHVQQGTRLPDNIEPLFRDAVLIVLNELPRDDHIRAAMVLEGFVKANYYIHIENLK